MISEKEIMMDMETKPTEDLIEIAKTLSDLPARLLTLDLIYYMDAIKNELTERGLY